MGLCQSRSATLQDKKNFAGDDELNTTLRGGSKLDLGKADKFRFVIVGFGVAAGYAAKQLADLGVQDFEVAIVGEEPTFAYERPALSKGYLFPPGLPDKVPARLPKFHTCAATGESLQTEEWYQEHNWTCYLGTKVTSIDLKKKLLKCQGPMNEEFIQYEKLIVCTGSKPLKLSCPGADMKHIYSIRSEQDAAALIRKLERETGNRFIDRKLAPLKGKSGVLQSSRKLGADEQHELEQLMKDDDENEPANSNAVVLGGGYLGIEMATALLGWGFEEVHLAFHGSQLYAKMPWQPRFREKVQEEIVKRAPKLLLHPNASVEQIISREESSQALGSVILNDGTTVETHILVSAIGATICGKELFPKKSITVVNKDNLAVDERLRLKSNDTKDVWVCGELAMSECGVEAARAMGKHAALSAFKDSLGEPAPPFNNGPLFRYSRLFEYTSSPLVWNMTGDPAKGSETRLIGEKNECGVSGPFATFHYDQVGDILKAAVVCGSPQDKELFASIRKLVESGTATLSDAVNEFTSRGLPL